VWLGPQIICTYKLVGTAYYNKPALSTQDFEDGTATGSTNCPGSNTISVSEHVVDVGLAFTSSTHQTSNSSSGTNGAYIDVSQTVGIYGFPFDWHAYGSKLEWTSKFHITPDPTVTLYGPADLCIGFSAVYGGGISSNNGTGC
jgi:hypothetical protein